ncbi:MAG: hypothetical protein R3A51_22555 [Nannocystaceae bacterium]
MARVITTTLGVVAGAAITVGGLYWLYTRLFGEDGEGSGFGFGIGGSGKGDELFKKGAAGPAEEPGGTGGDAAEPGGTGDGGGAKQPTASGGGGTKPTDKPGAGDKPQGTGKGDKPSGGGSGGAGGGLGGGSGGGVGSGEGSGMSGDTGEGGEVGEEEGGGEEDQYGGWGELLITEELAPPDISAAKIDQLRETIYTLVGDTVYATELPPPLHEFNPELGLDIVYWADVALHLNYALPWGRLDPDNATHKPWIELWLDILQEVIIVENLLNADANEELDDPEWNASVGPQEPVYGLAKAAPRHARGLWRAHARRLRRRGEHPRDALARLLRRIG